MKSEFLAICAIILLLAIFLPLASENPDGLERVAEDYGVEESEPIYHAPFSYGDTYLQSLAAGIAGFVAVLVVALSLRKLVSSKR